MTDNKDFLRLFSFIIALVLLLLYSGTVTYLILKVIGTCSDGTTTNGIDQKGVAFVVTTIGGLISALVIARLSLTDPGSTPAILNLATLKNAVWQKWAPTLEMIHLLTWLLTGLAALLVGTMFCPDKSEVLSNIGTSWIGLTVVAGYAYFGLDPGS